MSLYSEMCKQRIKPTLWPVLVPGDRKHKPANGAGLLPYLPGSFRAIKQGTAYEAENPAHHFHTQFTSHGVHLAAETTAWAWDMAFTGWGYGDRIENTEPVAPVGLDNRVEYRRGPLIEWYLNTPAGLEQGFTLLTPPAAPRKDHELAIRLRVPL